MEQQAQYAVKFSPGWPNSSYRIYDCNSRLSSFVESVDSWPTEAAAQAAADRCNAGNRDGIRFACYADD